MLSKVDSTAEDAVASALVTVTSETRAGLGCLLDLVDLLLQLRPELVELALRLRAGRCLGPSEVCEAVDELVGGPLHVLRGHLHGGLVERERVVGEGLDRLLDAGHPRAQLTADFACPLLGRALLVAAAAGQRDRGRESEDDGEQAEVTGGHPGILRALRVRRKRQADPRMLPARIERVSGGAVLSRAFSAWHHGSQ